MWVGKARQAVINTKENIINIKTSDAKRTGKNTNIRYCIRVVQESMSARSVMHLLPYYKLEYQMVDFNMFFFKHT